MVVRAHDLLWNVRQIVVPFFFTRLSQHLDVGWPLTRRLLHVLKFVGLLHRRRHAGLILIISLVHVIDELHSPALFIVICRTSSWLFHIWGVWNAGTMMILAKTSKRVLSVQRTWCLTNITVLKLIIWRLVSRTVILHPHRNLHSFIIKWKLITLLLLRRRLRKLLAALSDFFSHISSAVRIHIFLSTLLTAHV